MAATECQPHALDDIRAKPMRHGVPLFSAFRVAAQEGRSAARRFTGRSLLIERDIGDSLLDVNGPAISVAGRYWLVITPETASSESYALFGKWVKTEVERSQAIAQSYF